MDMNQGRQWEVDRTGQKDMDRDRKMQVKGAERGHKLGQRAGHG
jgi:hypothetical protein